VFFTRTLWGTIVLEAAAKAALAANVVSYRFVAALLRRGAIPPNVRGAGRVMGILGTPLGAVLALGAGILFEP
jgi:hypothetical protein